MTTIQVEAGCLILLSCFVIAAGGTVIGLAGLVASVIVVFLEGTR